MQLTGGNTSYMKVGKDIQRFSTGEIDEEVEKMNANAGIFDLLSNSKLFGNVEYLDDIKTTEEIVIAIHENWKSCGYIDKPCTMQILENDKEVYFYLIGFFNDEMTPVLDPQFSSDKKLIQGLSIMKMKDIIAMKHLFKDSS